MSAVQATFKMSNISFRPVHGVRFFIILLSVCVILFWYMYTLKSRGAELAVPRISIDEPRISLQADAKQFTLNGKKFQILSGAIHYFRVHPEYWRDRLLKLKACGLNTVETYVPWNLHEEVKGEFNFEGFLDLEGYLKLAQELGLYVIFRPGPYICSEWDFGGLPSWLLNEPDISVRTTDPKFLNAVDAYFDYLMPIVEPYQYSEGGPIIAVQVENEYGSYGSDLNYMVHIKEALEKRGIKELFLTSDNSGTAYTNGQIPGVFMTANFQVKPEKHFETLQSIQGEDKPLMVMEYWSGWFDHWGEDHHVLDVEEMEKVLIRILSMGASVNFYMFHGGTNFGFMNGANIDYDGKYQPDITSYDYDAPLSEAGDLTEKYFKIKEILQKHAQPGMVPNVLPSPPKIIGKISGKVKVQMTHFMPLTDAMELVDAISSDNVMPMEMIPINNMGGQGYGFVVYRTVIDGKAQQLSFTRPVKDRGQVFINGVEIGVVTSFLYGSLQLTNLKPGSGNILDIVVENQGRVNYGIEMATERKGIYGQVQVDGVKIKTWQIYPLEFKSDFMVKVRASLKWHSISNIEKYAGPALYKGTYSPPAPQDAFIDMQGWTKGALFINNFNLGRYWDIGPQKTYYAPGPLFKNSPVEIIVFEQHKGSTSVTLTDKHDLGTPVHVKNDEDED
ncbi:beta-galactosidase-1-like protein 2 isoform X2 [Glandiceps talaboti]